MGLWEAYDPEEDSDENEPEDDLDDEDLGDDDYEDLPVCPECGSDGLTIITEAEDGNHEYECDDCGERFRVWEDEDE